MTAPAPQTRREARERERHPVRPGPPAPRRPGLRAIAHHLLSAGVLLFVAVLAVGLSVPANAFYPAGGTRAATTAPVAPGVPQALAVDPAGVVAPAARDDVTVQSWAQQLAQKYKGLGVGGAFTGPVRWPFPYTVAILSPYGPRGPVPGCPSCAPFHSGVDLAGGNGNPIFSIADGVVQERTGGSWTYGTYAVIVSRVDGHEITAIYEHMQDGSSPLVVGQRVSVGDFIGLVGESGEATAPHLHLEIDVDGERTDPIGWLNAHVS